MYNMLDVKSIHLNSVMLFSLLIYVIKLPRRFWKYSHLFRASSKSVIDMFESISLAYMRLKKNIGGWDVRYNSFISCRAYWMFVDGRNLLKNINLSILTTLVAYSA